MTPFMSMKIHSGQIKKFRFKKIINQSRSWNFEPMKSVACPRKHDYWKSYFPNICRHMVNWTVLFKWNELTNQKLRISTNQMSIIPNCFSILVYWSLVWPVLLLLLSLLSDEIQVNSKLFKIGNQIIYKCHQFSKFSKNVLFSVACW